MCITLPVPKMHSYNSIMCTVPVKLMLSDSKSIMMFFPHESKTCKPNAHVVTESDLIKAV